MRILFISTTFPDATAPARGTYNSALCRELALEHEVCVIAPRTFPEAIKHRLKGYRYQAALAVANAGIETEFPTYWYTPRVMQDRYGDQMWWSIKRSVTQAIEQFQPDAVLSYWAHPEGDVGIRAARTANVPAAVIVGGTDVLILPKLRGRGPRVKEVLLNSNAVITVSNGLRDAVLELGANADQVQTIYQGIESHVFHQNVSRAECQKKLGLDPSRKHLVWVGRMVPVKALPVLMKAAKLLHDRDIPFQLNMIGDGPDRKSLEAFVEQTGLENRVRFVGSVGHDDIADWYRAADLTVMSSNSEGLPNVLRESLACGTPFVCTKVGSVHEIAEPEYSRLCEKQNPIALASAIEAMLNNKAQQAAANYQPRTWDVCAAEVVELFEQRRSAMGLPPSGASPVDAVSTTTTPATTTPSRQTQTIET